MTKADKVLKRAGYKHRPENSSLFTSTYIKQYGDIQKKVSFNLLDATIELTHTVIGDYGKKSFSSSIIGLLPEELQAINKKVEEIKELNLLNVITDYKAVFEELSSVED